MYLAKLHEQMGIASEFDKALIAAVVFDTIRNNSCGMNSDNMESVVGVLTEGVDKYHFDILSLAAGWGNDVNDLLVKHLGLSCKSIYEEYIWPYLQQNEVVLGVKMK